MSDWEGMAGYAWHTALLWEAPILPALCLKKLLPFACVTVFLSTCMISSFVVSMATSWQALNIVQTDTITQIQVLLITWIVNCARWSVARAFPSISSKIRSSRPETEVECMECNENWQASKLINYLFTGVYFIPCDCYCDVLNDV